MDGQARRPTTYRETQSAFPGIHEARERFEALALRDALAGSRATLIARGDYDPARHGTGEHEPLTIAEQLEVLAIGEVLAHYYRHPAQVHGALQAGATWAQIAGTRGCGEYQARREYRGWAADQHHLWADTDGKFGLDDAEYAAAIARAAKGQLEPDPAEVHGFGRNQPGPYDQEAGQ